MVQKAPPMKKGGTEKGAVLIGSLIGVTALAAGGYLFYSRYGPIRAKISNLTVKPTTVKTGAAVQATVSWQNSGVKPYAFDVVVFFGDLSTMTGWGRILLDVSSNPLQQQDTTISVTVPSDMAAQRYDAHAVICDATEVGNGQYELEEVYALLTKEDLVTVEGPASVEIPAFSICKA